MQNQRLWAVLMYIMFAAIRLSTDYKRYLDVWWSHVTWIHILKQCTIMQFCNPFLTSNIKMGLLLCSFIVILSIVFTRWIATKTMQFLHSFKIASSTHLTIFEYVLWPKNQFILIYHDKTDSLITTYKKVEWINILNKLLIFQTLYSNEW